MRVSRPTAVLLAAVFGAIVFGAAAAVTALAGDGGGPEPLVPARRFKIEGDFRTKGGETANDVSGVACAPPGADGRSLCVVVDDQTRFAQAAFLKDGALVLGARIQIVDPSREADIYGRPPQDPQCPKNEGAFKDLDGEGVAYAAPYFYVVGSHGCTRGDGEFMRSSFVTARFRLTPEGRLAGEVETTYRLSDALAAARRAEPFFSRRLQERGLNIEGVAVIDGVLYAGARAPSIDGEAPLIGAPVEDLFAPGQESLPLRVTEIMLALGEKTGVRDLAVLPDGRLLILSGPTRDQKETPFSLFVAQRPAPDSGAPLEPKLIGRLEEVWTADENNEPRRAKPEAVLPLSVDDGELRALILYDTAKNGRPTEFRAPLPPR